MLLKISSSAYESAFGVHSITITSLLEIRYLRALYIIGIFLINFFISPRCFFFISSSDRMIAIILKSILTVSLSFVFTFTSTLWSRINKSANEIGNNRKISILDIRNRREYRRRQRAPQTRRILRLLRERIRLLRLLQSSQQLHCFQELIRRLLHYRYQG